MNRRRAIAFSYGLVCHLCFALGVGLMAYGLFWGLSRSLCPVGGTVGRLFNLVLVLQFPLLHSFLLSESGRGWLRLLAPREYSADLQTTLFALVAALQLIAVFCFWTPTETIWFEPQGKVLLYWSTLFVASWLFLMRSLFDAGLELQSGYLGWSSLYRGKVPKYPGLPTTGVFRFCRQPIYLSFFLIIISAPVWTLDHAILAMIWGSYCFLGPIFKEARFLRWYGSAFREYQTKVPYWLPLPGMRRFPQQEPPRR